MDDREKRFDSFGFESPFAPGEGERSGSVFEATGPSEYEFDLAGHYPIAPAWEIDRESAPDPLKLAAMLGIPGRFDDPKRDPSIDKDGTRFEAFLNGGDRATFAEKWLSGRPALGAAAREPQGDLKSSDIAKAWFVIHDVGVKSSLSDTRFKAKDTKKKSVHGFVNRAGNYAATHDFAKRKSGTIYEFVSKRGLTIAGGKTVNIETVPDIEVVGLKPDGTLPAPSNAKSYASIGFRRNRPARGKATFYKWTKEAFDVTADLYILASARAGHLLTLTAHKEMDRNLGRSVIWRELSASEMAKPATKYLKAARDRPSDYHGDPYAFDFQALYDVITRKLNALGGARMPAGARYGIHPLRVRKVDGEDIGNGDSQKHEFPHQSDPVVKRDTGLKKTGWWKAAKTGDAAKEYESDSEDHEFENFDDEVADPGHAFEDEFPITPGENESFDPAYTDESAWTGEEEDEDEEESLAWLDLERAEADFPQFEDEAGRASKPRGMPKPLLGGQLWSSSEPKFGIKQAIFVSPAALNLGRAEILFYVHGLLGPCGGRPKGGMASLISEAKFALGASVVASGRPMILIVPQFQDGGDASWSTHGLARPEGLNRYLVRRMAEVGKMLNAAPPIASDLIVAGHSKAYEVLYRLAGSHASPAMAQGPLACVSGLWLLDASYGRFPREAITAFLATKPGLKVKLVYRDGSGTDKFAGKQSDGRLALIPVPAKAVSHCAIPARCLPDLLANRAVGVSTAALPTREDSYALDFPGETQEEDLFELENEQGAWTESYGEDEDSEDEAEEFDYDVWGSESEDEAEHRCSHDEALFEGIEPFMESENWSESPDQIAFRERVLVAHIKRTEKRKKTSALPDLTEKQLEKIPETKIKTRKDTAEAAGRLLAAANAALGSAQTAGDADALKIRNISVQSGYRSGTKQLNLWRRLFSAKGGYYDKTEARRQNLPGGPHSDAAIAYLFKKEGEGGFGLGGRIAAPGFSNHQNGIALDFQVNLKNGTALKLSSAKANRAIWRKSWFHKWLKLNAAEFGFQPIPTEEWHWEYRPGVASQPQKFDAFADEDEDAFRLAEDEDAFGEDYLFEAEDEAEDFGLSFATDEWEDNEEPVAFSSDLAPEPYQIRGGLYTAQQKTRAAGHPAGLLLTSTIVGHQESKLVGRGPGPILIGKELTRFEGGKLGVWIADYNAFTYDFEEVLRAMGRLRDLLSAGSPEAPGDMTALQKHGFKPTDDTQASNAKKQAYTEWRQAQQLYGGLVAEVPRAAREVGLARKYFWQAQGRLSRSIAVAKKLDKPAFEAIDFRLSDIVSVATAGSVAGGAVTGFALLADWLIEARKKRAEYDKKLKEFVQTVKDMNAAVRDDLETFQNAGERYWMQVKLHREKVDERDKARTEARKKAALFAQSLGPASEKRKAVLAAIRMPAQVADAWRTLAIAGPRAFKALESLKGRWSTLDAAIFHFKRSKPDPFGLEDITQIVVAARRAESWKGVLTKDDVEEWVAMNGLWEEAYAKFFA